MNNELVTSTLNFRHRLNKQETGLSTRNGHMTFVRARCIYVSYKGAGRRDLCRVALSRPCQHSTDFALYIYGPPDAERYLERERAGRRKGHHC